MWEGATTSSFRCPQRCHFLRPPPLHRCNYGREALQTSYQSCNTVVRQLRLQIEGATIHISFLNLFFFCTRCTPWRLPCLSFADVRCHLAERARACVLACLRVEGLLVCLRASVCVRVRVRVLVRVRLYVDRQVRSHRGKRIVHWEACPQVRQGLAATLGVAVSVTRICLCPSLHLSGSFACHCGASLST